MYMNIKRELQNMKQNLKELKIKLKRGGGQKSPLIGVDFFYQLYIELVDRKSAKIEKN